MILMILRKCVSMSVCRLFWSQVDIKPVSCIFIAKVSSWTFLLLET